jgi:hypothetical protein
MKQVYKYQYINEKGLLVTEIMAIEVHKPTLAEWFNLEGYKTLLQDFGQCKHTDFRNEILIPIVK